MTNADVARVADALEERFKQTIASMHSNLVGRIVRFEDTGVHLPKREIWESYATSAIAAMKGADT